MEAAAADGAAGAAAAVLRASEYDWEAWAGKAAELPAALRRVDDEEMTAMLTVSAVWVIWVDGCRSGLLLCLSVQFMDDEEMTAMLTVGAVWVILG